MKTKKIYCELPINLLESSYAIMDQEISIVQNMIVQILNNTPIFKIEYVKYLYTKKMPDIFLTFVAFELGIDYKVIVNPNLNYETIISDIRAQFNELFKNINYTNYYNTSYN